MNSKRTFEDLDIWQRARAFALRIHELTCKGNFAKDWSLRDQITRSAGSIMDNIAEGFERGGNRELINFLSYAKGSAGETRSQLYRAFDKKHISEEMLNDLRDEALLISKMISGFMSYLQKSDFKGSKFHEPNVADYSMLKSQDSKLDDPNLES